MGLVSVTVYMIFLRGVQLLASVFLGWVLVAVYKTTAAVTVRGSRTQQRQEQVLCPCVFEGHCNAVQLTMHCTVAAVFFFWLFNVFGVAYGVAHFAVCHWPCVTVTALYYCSSATLFIGFALMSVTHFERLRLTFSGTPMPLPQWAPNVLYATILMSLVLFTASMGTRWTVGPSVAALFLVLLIVWYFATLSALIRVFYKKTMAVAISGQRSEITFIETAVRVTVVVTTSLVATMFTVFCWIALYGACPKCRFWLLVCAVILVLDTCLNAFCLMCTFARADNYYYMRVFGKIHRWFLKRAMDGRCEVKDEMAVAHSLPST